MIKQFKAEDKLAIWSFAVGFLFVLGVGLTNRVEPIVIEGFWEIITFIPLIFAFLYLTIIYPLLKIFEWGKEKKK